MTVFIREHDRTIEDGEFRHSVCHKSEHPEYNDKTQDNDIAILHLCKPIMYTKGTSSTYLQINRDEVYYLKLTVEVDELGRHFLGISDEIMICIV